MAMIDAFTNSLIEDLIRDEGSKNFPYADSEGILTIGVGRNLEDRGLSDSEIAILLGNDLVWVSADLDRNIPWWRELSSDRQRALANMCFNLGWPRLSNFKLMLGALEAGNWHEAADQALNSIWAHQVGERAERVAVLIKGD